MRHCEVYEFVCLSRAHSVGLQHRLPSHTNVCVRTNVVVACGDGRHTYVCTDRIGSDRIGSDRIGWDGMGWDGRMQTHAVRCRSGQDRRGFLATVQLCRAVCAAGTATVARYTMAYDAHWHESRVHRTALPPHSTGVARTKGIPEGQGYRLHAATAGSPSLPQPDYI